MNKQWMALLLSAGMAVTTCPVPGAQEPPAEQIHTEQAEESSAAVHSDDSDREGTAADEFQSETEPSGSETETGAYEEEPCWIYRPCVLIFRKLQKQRK
jgi:hypothetical protein